MDDAELKCQARWIRDEDGAELLEFDVPQAHYKAVKFGPLTPDCVVDEWFPVELIEEPKG